MIHLTRSVAHALAEADHSIGYPGSVEQWNRRFGAPTMAALDAAGLVQRQEHWTGCLDLTELGERLGRRLRQLAGSDSYDADDPVREARWVPAEAGLSA